MTLVQQMGITDGNLAGNVHGGTLAKLIDNAAGLAAAKHCGGLAVTAAMDDLSFILPVYIGDVVSVKAMVNQAWHTSMEVGVRVEAENFGEGRHDHTASAYLVFVALDEDGEPRRVPPVIAETDEERQRQKEAELRRETRLSRKEAIKRARAAEREELPER